MSDNSFTTQVPQPYFGPNGFVAPTENAILVGVQADLNTALGGNIDPSLTNPTGQIATTETAEIGDSNAQFLYFVNGVDPAYNSGRMQDAIGRIYFMSRIAGQPSVQPCIVAGLSGTSITAGAVTAQDPGGNLWLCLGSGTVVNGTLSLDFSAATIGPISGPATLTIQQAPPGVESITPTGDAAIGTYTETAAQFELRRQQSVAANAIQILDAIQGQVLALSGVLDCYCYENDTSTGATVGGVLIGANSIYVCVLGGTPSAIAQAMWTKKGPGCAYTGNTFETVTDPNPAYNPPPPSYVVAYQTPVVTSFVAMVVLANNSGIPQDAAAQVQQAIIGGFAGLDGGTRAKIGSTVYASRYYGDVATLGSWALIISIRIGVLGSGAVFTGSISGSTLTVSAVASGSLAAGQLLQDAGLLSPGTLIVAQLSGTAGSTGTYSVSVTQTIGSEGMTATDLVNDVTMHIDQAPVIAAGNINVVVQNP